MMKTEIMKSTDVDLARASPIMKGSTGTIQQTYVALGEIIFTDHPETYNLLGIGTCVIVYLFDIKNHRYMMAHCVLPRYEEKRANSINENYGKYTDFAIRLMVERLTKNGSSKHDIKAKIVGGGQIYEDHFKIGEKNIESAKNTLAAEKVELLGEDLGGSIGRSILRFNSDGTILIRKNSEIFTI